mgnify:CR=1 FL=1
MNIYSRGMGYGDGREVRRKKEAIDYAGGLCGGRQPDVRFGSKLNNYIRLDI